VNGPEIQHLIEQNLRRAVARIVEVPRPDPFSGSPWVAMSVLQKSIRRGRKDLALRAAATLLRDTPDRLWRRLGCIAAEDIGLGDLDAVGIATAALAGVRKRADLGGAWPVACAVVAALANAPKCRTADDLLMICELHPANARQRIEFRHRSSRELTEIVCGATTIATSSSRGPTLPRYMRRFLHAQARQAAQKPQLDHARYCPRPQH
jgi:hypothetical protein